MNMFFYLALLTKEKNQVKRKHKKKKTERKCKKSAHVLSRHVKVEGNEIRQGSTHLNNI